MNGKPFYRSSLLHDVIMYARHELSILEGRVHLGCIRPRLPAPALAGAAMHLSWRSGWLLLIVRVSYSVPLRETAGATNSTSSYSNQIGSSTCALSRVIR